MVEEFKARRSAVRRLGKGDELVEFEVSSEARRNNPSLPTHFDALTAAKPRISSSLARGSRDGGGAAMDRPDVELDRQISTEILRRQHSTT
jgi:hypothetical protein